MGTGSWASASPEYRCSSSSLLLRKQAGIVDSFICFRLYIFTHTHMHMWFAALATYVQDAAHRHRIQAASFTPCTLKQLRKQNNYRAPDIMPALRLVEHFFCKPSHYGVPIIQSDNSVCSLCSAPCAVISMLLRSLDRSE